MYDVFLLRKEYMEYYYICLNIEYIDVFFLMYIFVFIMKCKKRKILSCLINEESIKLIVFLLL